MAWLNRFSFFRQTLNFSVASEKGPREENQDNYLIRQPSGKFEMLKDELAIAGKSHAKTKGWWRFAVMDGMGGHANGRQISERLAELLAHAPTAEGVDSLKQLIIQLHEVLYHEFHFSNDEHAPGTTVVIAEISAKNEMIIAHVGDSRAYFQGNGQSWEQITEDHHSLTFEKRLDFCYQNNYQNDRPLAQAMGFGSFGVFTDKGQLIKQYNKNIRLDTKNTECANDVKCIQLQPASKLLLATDGVWHTKENSELPIPEGIENAEEIVQYAVNSGGTDNATSILITFRY